MNEAPVARVSRRDDKEQANGHLCQREPVGI